MLRSSAKPGVKVIAKVVASYATAPATAEPPGRSSRTEVVLIVDASIGRENSARTSDAGSTSVAPEAGVR